MSKHKFAEPTTYTLGSSPKLDDKGNRMHGIHMPLMTVGGQPVGSKPLLPKPMFNPGKPEGHVLHWRNEAARRRNGGDKSKAGPNELVVVPLFRGIPSSEASYLRARFRRERKVTFLEKVRERLAAAAKKAITTVSPSDNEQAA